MYYKYEFSDGEFGWKTPQEAQTYSIENGVEITQDGYNQSRGTRKKKQKAFDGFGYHDSLKMNFRGPKHYREYLKENGLHESGSSAPPQYKEEKTEFWDDETVKQTAEIAGGLDEGTVRFLRDQEKFESIEKDISMASETNGGKIDFELALFFMLFISIIALATWASQFMPLGN